MLQGYLFSNLVSSCRLKMQRHMVRPSIILPHNLAFENSPFLLEYAYVLDC
jgi:hypothetical protein